MSASVGIFVGCWGQATRQYAVKATLPICQNECVCVCVCVCVCLCVCHKTQMPANSRWPRWAPPGWAVMSGAEAGTGSRWKGHGRGEERGRGREEEATKNSSKGFFYQPGREILLWIRERYKQRKHGGMKRSLDIRKLSSAAEGSMATFPLKPFEQLFKQKGGRWST